MPHKKFSASLLAFLLLFAVCCSAAPRIAVLDFELKDLTPAPNIPSEIARTASIKPLLEQELAKKGFNIVRIAPDAVAKAAAGPGYLFDHHDLAGQLARTVEADYIVAGRLHKPSYLFVYLMAHLVDAKQGKLIGDYISEVKGGDRKLTAKGVESLAEKIQKTLDRTAFPPK
jgi:hypothetical protein